MRFTASVFNSNRPLFMAICRISSVILLAAAVMGTSPARAQSKLERPVISLSGANFRPLPMAVAPPLLGNNSASRPAATEIDETLIQDLSVCGLFELLDRKSFLADSQEGVLPADIKFSRWQDVGASSLIKMTVSGKDPVTAEFHLYSTVSGKEELKQRYQAPASQARTLAHKFADEVFTFYTREPGAFQTKIAFVRRIGGFKQVFVADWDGKNARQITNTSMNLLPAWSPNGQRVAFTGYKSGMPDLWAYNFRTQKADVLVQKGSLLTGACFSSDGKRMTFAKGEDDGNSHIWIADSHGGNPRKLTDGFGINTSPSFSPDGKQIAFVSNRAGNPQIYLISSAGGEAKRITFQGNYNQTPDWSPRGDLIAFTARDERNMFDIFTVDVATGKITRLTQDQGNNEEPSFSPNGRLIAFTSTRGGVRQLFVMSADGNFQRSMASGEAFTPAWGPFVK